MPVKRAPSSTDRKRTHAPHTKRVPKKLMEEIPSDSEDIETDDEAGAQQNDEEDYEEETAQEKRYRLAKQYLAELERQETEKSEDKLVDEKIIAAKLKEHAEQARRVQKRIADSLIVPEPSNVRVLSGHQRTPTCVAVSEDGTVAVSGSKDGGLIKWDVESGKALHKIRGLVGFDRNNPGHRSVRCLAISDDQKFLCTGGEEKYVNVWDFRTMEHIRRFDSHRKAVTGLKFRRGYHQLYSCSEDQSVKIWDLDEMGYVDTMFGHTDTIASIDALSRERAVTCGSRDRTVRIWKIPEESQLIFRAHSSCGSVDCVRLIDDEHFVSGADDGSLSLWSVFKKKPTCVRYRAHGNSEHLQSDLQHWISSICTCPFTDLIASGSCDQQLKFWKCGADYKSLEVARSYQLPGFINALGCDQQGKTVVCAVGPEHKDGRWWKLAGVKSSIVIVPLLYSSS